MATYTYKGTRITGMSTTAKVFPQSGVASAAVNNTYFNTETGHVYVCSTAGKPSEAKWRYVRTDIAHKPSIEVCNLGAPVRTTSGSYTRVMKATWKVPSALTNTKSGDRAQGLEVDWYLGVAGTDPVMARTTPNLSTTTHQINLDALTIGSKSYNRQSFYPNTSKKLYYVTTKVKAYNDKGSNKGVQAKREFKKPRKPVISAFSFNKNSGRVSASITTNAGTDNCERYDTKYKVKVYNSVTKITTTPTDSSSTSTNITNVGYDYSGYQSLGDKEYIKVLISAAARGYAGNSDTVTRECYISAPSKASIGKIEPKTERCVVKISIPKEETHPVSGVRLQYVSNSDYQKASQIADGAWNDYDVTDDRNCTALVIDENTIKPDAGRYSWVRVKTWNWDESVPVLCQYSEPKRVTAYETKPPTATDEEIKIISATAGKGGKSILVQLGWNASGEDDATGTELTWSEDEDTWKSTKDPDKYEFTWTDGRYPKTGTLQYNDSALITIKGLNDSTKYYIKARRYLEGDLGTSYSPYSDPVTCMTSNVTIDADELVETVVATCNGIVANGSSLPVYWTFSSSAIQTDWQIVNITTENNAEVENGIILDGEGSVGAAQIPFERLAEFADNGRVTFKVYASSGNTPAVSNTLSVNIVDKPELTVSSVATNVSGTPTLQAQPFGFTVTTTKICDLMVIVSSQGAVGQFPTGTLRQTEGDTIYSDIITPVWTYSSQNSNWSVNLTLPDGLDFWDTNWYTLSVTGIDRDTNLQSEQVDTGFVVNWTNKAVVPFDAVTITPNDTTDDSGQRIRSVDIVLTAPTGSQSSDVYDIYRLTGDGAKLIGSGFPLSYTATDLYAPFGDGMTMKYRVALRTVNGDVNFSDIEYVADADYLKLDWDGHTIDLPYSVTVGDSYEKSVELRQHMDGSVDGYWNQNIVRKGDLRTDVIKLIQQNEIDLVRQLARYAGPVFVRTPDGSAYEADVQVTDLSTKNKAVLSIALDATEIGLTQEFMLPIPFTIS